MNKSSYLTQQEIRIAKALARVEPDDNRANDWQQWKTDVFSIGRELSNRLNFDGNTFYKLCGFPDWLYRKE